MTDRTEEIPHYYTSEQRAEIMARKKAAELKAIQDNEVLKTVLKTKEGRRVMWRLLGHCKVFESIKAEGGTIHYNCGRQDVGHHIQQLIKAAGNEFWLTMMKEASEGSYDV